MHGLLRHIWVQFWALIFIKPLDLGKINFSVSFPQNEVKDACTSNSCCEGRGENAGGTALPSALEGTGVMVSMEAQHFWALGFR